VVCIHPATWSRGLNVTRAISNMLEALQAQTGDLPALIEELRDLMAGRDLTQLINSVVVPGQ